MVKKVNSTFSRLLLFTFGFLLFPVSAFAVEYGFDQKVKQTKYTTLEGMLNGVKTYLLGFAGAIAVLFIIIGGLQYMSAGANPERAEKAKKTLTYAITGVIVILISEVLLAFLTDASFLGVFK